MIQLQLVLHVPSDAPGHLDFNLLEREDANDTERELARLAEQTFAQLFQGMTAYLSNADVQFIGPQHEGNMS